VRRVWLRNLAVTGIGLAVLAVVLVIATTIDARAPQVLEYRVTQPVGDDPTVALTTTSIEIAFNEPVDHATAERELRIEPEVDGSISWSGTTLIFTPAEPLPIETAFTVVIGSGVTDQAGNAMAADAAPFAFETAGRPQVLASTPADADAEVELDAPIQITFSALMDTESVEEALHIEPAVAFELRWAGEELELLPTRPLRAAQRYELSIAPDARDIAGVAIGSRWGIAFETVATVLEPVLAVPANDTDGIAGSTRLAVLFDEPIDPESLLPDQFVITPEVSGTVGLVELPATGEVGARYAVHFTPSGPFPPNTTVEVELQPGVRSVGGAVLTEPASWSFTTGAPIASLSNQVLFLSDRSGVTNLWAINPDGTGQQRQLSAELIGIVDFAISPDGRTIVLADGRRLILQAANGSQRRVLTGEDVLEYDPAWSPDGRSFAFGRADAGTGAGLGLWSRSADGGDERRVEIPEGGLQSPNPGGSPGDGPAANGLLRAPTYAPDGEALAFVDAAGVGIVDLAGADTVAMRAALERSGPPTWLPDASALLLVAGDGAGDHIEPVPGGPVLPLAVAEGGARIVLVERSDGRIVETRLTGGTQVAAIGTDGRVAYLRETDPSAAGGRLFVADAVDGAGRPVGAAAELLFSAITIAPEPATLVLAALDAETGEEAGVWLLDLEAEQIRQLTTEGRRPRWLP
jgi:hypothetical protein